MDLSLPAHPSFLLRLVAPGILLSLMGAEYLLQRGAYDAGETAASLALMIVGRALTAIAAGLVGLPMAWVYRHRLFDLPPSLWSAGLLLLVVELCAYWHHRAMHGVAWLWATHAVHHSSTRLNLSAALRFGGGGAATGGFLFYVPPVFLGFPPLAVAATLGVSLIYQYFLHLAAAPPLGTLGLVLNTPAHHHVHHASNAACRDKNFGGALIVFDRLFGTFAEAPAAEKLRYGLAGREPEPSRSLRVAIDGWRDILRGLWQAQTWRERCAAAFGPPR
ncbi:MAG TPA: sterol desaturase family protein [Stellaceae bacterium]|nr:sterol desaturase family protein [Stellaceae bacterium]